MPCKCYFSVPPLSPLLVWAYMRLIISVTYSVFACYLMTALLVQKNHSNPTLMPTTVWVGLAIVNLTFSNIFIVGLHNKTYTMLKIFLMYSVLEVILTSAWQVWRVIKTMPLFSYDTNSFDNYWRQQLTSTECLKFFVPLLFHILLPIYFITHIRRELLKIHLQKSPEVKELVKKAAEENILLNSSVTVEQNRENNFANSSAPAEETLSPLNGTVAEEQNRRYNFANSSAPAEETLPPLNGTVAEEQNRRYNFANSSAPTEETLLPFDSLVTEEQNRRYNFANSSAPTEESLLYSTVAAEQKRIHNFANPSAPPEEIALYPVDELKGLTTDNKDQ